MALRFDEASHTYTLGGRVLPSVTQVLKVIDPDQYAGIPREVLQRKREIGVSLHRAIELDVDGTLDPESIPTEVAPYFEAWRRWVDAMHGRMRIIASERRAASPSYGYAGTLDLHAQILDDEWLIDVKSVATLSPLTRIQTAAYARLVRDDPANPLRRGALQLRPDGRFVLDEHTSPTDWPTFLAALQLHRWRTTNLTH
jgi:hypothetical protein